MIRLKENAGIWWDEKRKATQQFKQVTGNKSEATVERRMTKWYQDRAK